MRAASTLFLMLILLTPAIARGQENETSSPAPTGQTNEAAADPSASADAANVRDGETTNTGDAATFDTASTNLQRRLEQSLQELSELREQIAEQTLPLSRTLRKLEGELVDVRQEFQARSRVLDSRSLDISNLNAELQARRGEAQYLSNLLTDYIRNFETRLHIAELDRHQDRLEAAKLAPENSNLSQQEIYATQAGMVAASIDRLEDVLGGARFEGSAAGDDGRVKDGRFVLIGPVALFSSDDGQMVGIAEQSLNAVTPLVRAFRQSRHADAASAVVAGTGQTFPFDPTLGKAYKIESTQATFWEYVERGGPVMVPIFALAGVSLLVALYKWVALMLTRTPSARRINALLQAVARRDEAAVREKAGAIKGPAGTMLAAGVEHMREPRELIEEVMYEHILSTRLKVQRMLPFIAITASASPLLGLLGTVTGIINTFELITAFGTGDVQALSGGISEALVTTMFGLIVAIPSLLLYAFLSRKARRVTDQMEKAALAFANAVVKSRSQAPEPQPQEAAHHEAAQPQPQPDEAADESTRQKQDTPKTAPQRQAQQDSDEDGPAQQTVEGAPA